MGKLAELIRMSFNALLGRFPYKYDYGDSLRNLSQLLSFPTRPII
jgi:hypothetical protein